MFRPTEAQAGALFGILACALILVLTVLALSANVSRPRPHATMADDTMTAVGAANSD
ncbi:MAG: hypothetical protein JSS00_13860 [Proteobacteria bacterium]|nr:hypothetical protein [Pseudomonadota bacterium]